MAHLGLSTPHRTEAVDWGTADILCDKQKRPLFDVHYDAVTEAPSAKNPGLVTRGAVHQGESGSLLLPCVYLRRLDQPK